jgi:hypothetical protein
MGSRINEEVARELEAIPRGPRGSDQNMLRALYQMIRTNALSESSRDNSTAEECLAQAVATIREKSPHFKPIVSRNLGTGSGDEGIGVTQRPRGGRG